MDDTQLCVLVGLLLGVALSLCFYFWHDPKKRLVEELTRTNRLHALRFTATLWKLLEEKDLMRAYDRLHTTRIALKLHEPKDAANRREASEIEADLGCLDSYLSVLEIICFAISEEVLDFQNNLNLMRDRLDDLNRHPEVCRYIDEYAGFYQNLIREMHRASLVPKSSLPLVPKDPDV